MVSIGPLSKAMQRELEDLPALKAENVELKRKLAYYESRSQPATNQPILVPLPSLSNDSSVPPQVGRVAQVQSNLAASGRPTTTGLKTHSVRPDETPTVIAKKYGVSVTALMAANPGVDARRLRIGQTLNIPAH